MPLHCAMFPRSLLPKGGYKLPLHSLGSTLSARLVTGGILKRQWDVCYVKKSRFPPAAWIAARAMKTTTDAKADRRPFRNVAPPGCEVIEVMRGYSHPAAHLARTPPHVRRNSGVTPITPQIAVSSCHAASPSAGSLAGSCVVIGVNDSERGSSVGLRRHTRTLR